MPLITLWNLAAAFLSLVGCAFFLGSAYAMVGLLGLPLDLLSMTTLVTVSAIGIRISLHFIGEFLLVWAHDDRTMCALQNSMATTLKVSSYLGLRHVTVNNYALTRTPFRQLNTKI
jgi:predicted RND superfamily exporter protein